MQVALIDTSAIFGLANRLDRYHIAAQAIGRKWLADHNRFVLLDWVFIEAMTLLKVRMGAAVAVAAGRDLRHSPLYQWVTLGPDDEHEVWSVFQKYDDKGWSYIDCGLFVMAQRLRINQVFSFDDHFKQMPGLKRLPK
jgi:predicted nucleic acid-binding protein